MEKNDLRPKRKMKVIISKAGGNAGVNSKSYRIPLPSRWVSDMGIDENNRLISAEYLKDDGIIIIKKCND